MLATIVFMNRRSVLSLLGTAIGGGLSGCSSNESENEKLRVEQSGVRALDKNCNNSNDDKAAITFNESKKEIAVSGRYGVRKISYKIDIATRTNVSTENLDRGDVEIRIDQFASSSTNPTVSDCSGAVDYEANVFLSHPPNEVIVQHVKEENDRAWIETVARSSP